MHAWPAAAAAWHCGNSAPSCRSLEVRIVPPGGLIPSCVIVPVPQARADSCRLSCADCKGSCHRYTQRHRRGDCSLQHRCRFRNAYATPQNTASQWVDRRRCSKQCSGQCSNVPARRTRTRTRTRPEEPLFCSTRLSLLRWDACCSLLQPAGDIQVSANPSVS